MLDTDTGYLTIREYGYPHLIDGKANLDKSRNGPELPNLQVANLGFASV